MGCPRTGAAVDAVAGDGVGADHCYSGSEGECDEGNEMHDVMQSSCFLWLGRTELKKLHPDSDGHQSIYREPVTLCYKGIYPSFAPLFVFNGLIVDSYCSCSRNRVFTRIPASDRRCETHVIDPNERISLRLFIKITNSRDQLGTSGIFC